MRITFNQMSTRYLGQIQGSLSNMTAASDRVINGRNLLNPESNPVLYVSAYNVQRMLDDSEQFGRNAQNASHWITNSDNELQRAVELISKAKNEYAVAGANDSQSASSRKALSGDVLNIYSSMMDIGNSKYLGRYIFAGQQTDTQPFKSQSNEVSAVTSRTASGDVTAQRVYGDLPELAEGDYTFNVSFAGDVATISLYDTKGNQVLLDSNGSDESGGDGNLAVKSMTVTYRPGLVVNTGRGVAITLPAEMTPGYEVSYHYKPGSEVNYYGDNREIVTKIGFSQDVAMNVTGRETFLQVARTVMGTRYNTTSGIPLTVTSELTNIDYANVSSADTIAISGTDHNGLIVGSARVQGTAPVNLNMESATVAERTLMLNYGEKYYSLVVPAQSYEDMDELLGVIRRELRYTQYAGSERTSGGVAPTEGYTGSMFTVDLTNEVEIRADGDRLMFTTTRAGDHVALSVTGQQHNLLGFENTTVAAQGRDTVFEIGFDDYTWSGGSTLEVTHGGLNLNTGNHSFYVNGERITVSVNSATSTLASIEMSFDAALKDAGFGYEVSAHLESLGGNSYNLTYTLQNNNYGRDTYLSTAVVDVANVTTDMKMVAPRPSNYPLHETRQVEEFVDFVEELYDNAVDARIENGKLVIEDLRAGSSRFSININERNEGVGYTNGSTLHVLGGDYIGAKNDVWDFTISVTDPGNGQRDVTLSVVDSKGNVLNNRTYQNYHGEEISLPYGVKLVPNAELFTTTGVHSFTAEMKANGSLSFGDMNIIQEGKNVNIFRSLDNLYDALRLDMPKTGTKEPSAWSDTSLRSTATPYFDGTFRGNYNDTWKYEIASTNSNNTLMIQKEDTVSTGTIRYINSAVSTLNVSIGLFNNLDGEIPVEFPLTLSVPTAGEPYANATDLRNALVSAVNSNTVLHSYGVKAEVENGKVVLKSGSGTQEISLSANDDATRYALGISDSPTVGATATELEFAANTTMEISYAEGNVWNTISVTLPAGNYADADAVATALTGLTGDPDLTFTTSEGKLVLNFGGAKQAAFISGDRDRLFGYTTKAEKMSLPDAVQPMDLSTKSVAERSLTFRSTTGGVESSTVITLPARVFTDIDDMISTVRTMMTSAGVSGQFDCVKTGDSSFGFAVVNPAVDVAMVAGDFNGTLGFRSAGDRATVKVSGEDGKIIQTIQVDTANKPEYVADGIFVGFDVGSLFATDSFTGVVGSGIDHEIAVLEEAENQLAQSLTTVGTRQNRVDAMLNFQETLKSSGERIKADYLGSEEADVSAAITEFSMAQQAYQYALTATSRLLQISLLDYLR